MIRLAHISDIHLGPPPPPAARDLMSKRLPGYLDWYLGRLRAPRSDRLSGLVDHLKSMRPNLVAVSGDLVNLGTRAEIDKAAIWLKALGSPARVAVVPGNHDAFMPGSLEVAQDGWGEYMRGQTTQEEAFPYYRRLGELALIGCNSGVPRPLFVHSGRFDIEQAKRLTEMLGTLGERGVFRVVMIHHPPEAEHAADTRSGLSGADLFRHAIEDAGAELVLHGHRHRSTIGALPGPRGEVPVLGVAAASSSGKRGEEPARYNLLEIERSGTGFSCTLNEYGYQRIGEGIVRRLRMRLS